MTDLELAEALWASQRQLCGYNLHVWTWADEAGVVHLLHYHGGTTHYRLRCTQQVLSNHRVPYNIKLPNCVWCACAMAR